MNPARWSAILAAVLVVCACGDSRAARGPTRVFVSASLGEVFEQLAEAYRAANPGARVEVHAAGTPQLVMQLREGAAADVVATADRPSLDPLLARATSAGEPAVFATNRLAIVTSPGNPAGITGLEDLARADLKVLLCAPEVPAGNYARVLLGWRGLSVTSVSDEPSVRAVLAKVALGEADAGVVYATDGREGVQVVPIPEDHNLITECPIVSLADDGQAFVAFVRSPQGRAILESRGFGAP